MAYTGTDRWGVTVKRADALHTEMLGLLEEARPLMVAKCCHFDWCVERSGIVTEDPAAGFHEIQDGMHPGCVRYRQWLDRLDDLVN